MKNLIELMRSGARKQKCPACICTMYYSEVLQVWLCACCDHTMFEVCCECGLLQGWCPCDGSGGTVSVLVDALSTTELVRNYIREHGRCSAISIRDGVDAKENAISSALRELTRQELIHKESQRGWYSPRRNIT